MTATAPDTPPLRGAQLADAVHTLILRHPERHNQRVWLARTTPSATLCASTGCVAGWAAVLGYPKLKPAWYGCYETDWVWIYDDAEGRSIKDAAREALELPAGWADWLFDGNRSRHEVLRGLLRLSRGQNPLPVDVRAAYDY